MLRPYTATMSFVEWLDQGLLSMVPMANMPLLVPRSRDRIPSQNRYAVRDERGGFGTPLVQSALRQCNKPQVVDPDSICSSCPFIMCARPYHHRFPHPPSFALPIVSLRLPPPPSPLLNHHSTPPTYSPSQTGIHHIRTRFAVRFNGTACIHHDTACIPRADPYP